MKITLSIKKTIVEESSVEVPCYTKCGSTYYHVRDENIAVSVWELGGNAAINLFDPNFERAFEDGYETITKEQYEEQFEKALSILKAQ